MAVIDIARKNVETGTPDELATDVVRRLHKQEVGALVIVDDDGEPLGLVGHRQLSQALLNDGFDPDETPVSEFIDDDLVTVDGDAGLYDLLDLLSDTGRRRVPVVEDGELAGIISISDVVILLGMELQHVANTIRSTSPAYEREGPMFFDR